MATTPSQSSAPAPTLGYEEQRPRSTRVGRYLRKWPWILAGLLLGSAIVGYLVASPRGGRSRGASERIHCASSLKMIGLALNEYANANAGELPPSFDELLASQPDWLGPECFVCPHGNCIAARGPTTQATLDQFARPGHCSYIYLGRGLKWTDDPKVILAYEPLADHGDGMNVLFGDGHAEYLKAPGVLPWIHWNERPVMRGDGKD